MAEFKGIFQWDKTKFTTLVDSMDREHEVLINLMNELFSANNAKVSKAELIKILDKLGSKTKEHFDHEESFFSGLKEYSQAGSHKKIHEGLLERFQEHAVKFKTGTGASIPEDFFVFLKVWLSAHICGVDRKYGEIAKAKTA